jgi:aspartyl-tRNA(Asn)/glutamyl-tRNA(Gln) amidotransferase subunit C
MITDLEFKKLQKLARISFADNELSAFAAKLTSVVSMIDELKKVDCSDVAPLRSVCDIDQRMREDEVTIFDQSEDLFKTIPEKDSEFAREIKCFVVPKVIE